MSLEPSGRYKGCGRLLDHFRVYQECHAVMEEDTWHRLLFLKSFLLADSADFEACCCLGVASFKKKREKRKKKKSLKILQKKTLKFKFPDFLRFHLTMRIGFGQPFFFFFFCILYLLI
ncbi:UNVERIFIED_CONTAM: hypothetical protein K2H54_026902 [Gekko kuhli]